MSALDRRTFLRGMLYGLLGAVLGWPEVEAIAANEAAPAEESSPGGTICAFSGERDVYVESLEWRDIVFVAISGSYDLVRYVEDGVWKTHECNGMRDGFRFVKENMGIYFPDYTIDAWVRSYETDWDFNYNGLHYQTQGEQNEQA